MSFVTFFAVIAPQDRNDQKLILQNWRREDSADKCKPCFTVDPVGTLNADYYMKIFLFLSELNF